jgi:hypothetical protein
MRVMSKKQITVLIYHHHFKKEVRQLRTGTQTPHSELACPCLYCDYLVPPNLTSWRHDTDNITECGTKQGQQDVLSVYSRNTPRRDAILVKIPERCNRAALAYHTDWSANSGIETQISSPWSSLNSTLRQFNAVHILTYVSWMYFNINLPSAPRCISKRFYAIRAKQALNTPVIRRNSLRPEWPYGPTNVHQESLHAGKSGWGLKLMSHL